MEMANEEILLGVVGMLPTVLFGLWVFYRVFRNSGRSGWWTVLMLVPGVNIVFLWIFSFLRWPAVEAADPERTPEIFS